MIAIEAQWFARVGNCVRLFISFGLHEPSSSDRNSINIILPVGAQRQCVFTYSTLRAPQPCSTVSRY